MARIRSLHPGQWTDEDFVLLDFPARLLALGIRNEADDQGVFEWKPQTIKMKIFPADNIDVEPLLDECLTHRQFAKFTVGGKDYGVIRNFRGFQRPKKPKILYPLPSEFRTYAGLSVVSPEPKTDEAPPVPNSDDLKPPEFSPNDPSSAPSSANGGNVSADVGRRVKEEGSKKDSESSLRSDSDAGASIPLCFAKPINGDWKALLFGRCREWLAGSYHEKPEKLRPLLGKWLQSCHDDPEKLVGLIADCQREDRADPKAWITACLKESKDETNRSGTRPSKSQRAKAAVQRAAVAGGYAGAEPESKAGTGDDAVSVLPGSEAVRQGTGGA